MPGVLFCDMAGPFSVHAFRFCLFVTDWRCRYGTRCDSRVRRELIAICARFHVLRTNLQNEDPSLPLAYVAPWLLHQCHDVMMVSFEYPSSLKIRISRAAIIG